MHICLSLLPYFTPQQVHQQSGTLASSLLCTVTPSLCLDSTSLPCSKKVSPDRKLEIWESPHLFPFSQRLQFCLTTVWDPKTTASYILFNFIVFSRWQFGTYNCYGWKWNCVLVFNFLWLVLFFFLTS